MTMTVKSKKKDSTAFLNNSSKTKPIGNSVKINLFLAYCISIRILYFWESFPTFRESGLHEMSGVARGGLLGSRIWRSENSFPGLGFN